MTCELDIYWNILLELLEILSIPLVQHQVSVDDQAAENMKDSTKVSTSF